MNPLVAGSVTVEIWWKFSEIWRKSVCCWISIICFEPRREAIPDGNRLSPDAFRLSWNIMKFLPISYRKARWSTPWETGALRRHFWVWTLTRDLNRIWHPTLYFQQQSAKICINWRHLLEPPGIYTWNSWVIVHRQTIVQVAGLSDDQIKAYGKKGVKKPWLVDTNGLCR